MTQLAIPVPEDVGLLYDRFAALTSASLGANLHYGYWEGLEDQSSLAEATEHLTELMIRKVRVGRGEKILDVGCGVGTPAIRLARTTGADVTGITVSRKQIVLATEQAEAEGLGGQVRFQLANAMDLPFDSRSFAGVWALESIIHMPDRAQVLRELGRVVRPGGRVVLTDFFERAPIPPRKWPAVERYYRDFMMSQMARIDDYPGLVRNAGLLLEELVDISDNVMRRTVLALSARLRENKQRLEAEYGAEMVHQFDPGELADTWELGYLVMVARRPED